jgi:hypothetical protein
MTALSGHIGKYIQQQKRIFLITRRAQSPGAIQSLTLSERPLK